MALPKLNETLKHDMIIPSTGRAITYRPYLVKEEKILLQAIESQDQKQAMRAMVDTVVACVTEDIRANELTTFDVEYMFTQVRAKSVGESSTVNIACSAIDCENKTEVQVDLTSVELNEADPNNIIELTPEISVEVAYPSYTSFLRNYKEGMSETEFAFVMLEDCLAAILTPDERIDVREASNAEVKEFINSMTSKQFEKIGDYLQTAPKMRKTVEFKCSECGHDNNVTLEGLQDFF